MASLSASSLFNVKDMVFVITGAGSGKSQPALPLAPELPSILI